jgi:hypothetical protein
VAGRQSVVTEWRCNLVVLYSVAAAFVAAAYGQFQRRDL